MDASGGVVTGVSVKVTQEDTNLTFSGQTDGIGRYAFLALPVGRLPDHGDANRIQND